MSMIPHSREESVLELLYDAYCGEQNIATDQIRKAFKSLYEVIHSTEPQDPDNMTFEVCALCLEHEKNGFMHGIRVGMQLYRELTTEIPQ